MLLATVLAALAAGALAQKKLAPPPGQPAFRIYLDLDGFSEGGDGDACEKVQSQRGLCWSKGQASGKYRDEQTCLCTPETAEAASQCFAYSYSKITNTTEKSLYYQNYLYYLYDCYCGITQTDVSYNATTNKPYITGLNGTLILPPDAGCPAPPNDCPSPPPCGCKPKEQPTKWKQCKAGERSVGGECVPDCQKDLPPACPPPRKLVGKNCECVWPNVLDKNGNCGKPPCPPGQILGCKGCVCPKGQEFGATTDTCVPFCPENTRRSTPGGPCEPFVCPRPAPWKTTCGGQCYCPLPYVQTPDGQCTMPPDPCQYPKVQDDWNPGYCYCPCPYSTDSYGNCYIPEPLTNCTAPLEPSPWEPGACYCPYPNEYDPYTGVCSPLVCVAPEVPDANEPICRCPAGNAYNEQGECVPISCTFPQQPDPYNALQCVCAYPWSVSGTTCECVTPNSLDATGECIPPILMAPDTDIPTIEPLVPNDTVIPPEVSMDPLSMSSVFMSESASAPPTDIPSDSAAISTDVPTPTDVITTPTDVPSDGYPTPTDTPTEPVPTPTDAPPVETATDAPAPPAETTDGGFAPPSMRRRAL